MGFNSLHYGYSEMYSWLFQTRWKVQFQRIFFPWRPGVLFTKGAAEVKLLKGLEIDSLKLSKSNMAFYAIIGLYTQRHYFSLRLRPAQVLPCRTVNMISLWAGKTSGHEYRENKARWGLLKNSWQFLCICAALMLTENKQYMYYSAFFPWNTVRQTICSPAPDVRDRPFTDHKAVLIKDTDKMVSSPINGEMAIIKFWHTEIRSVSKHDF